MEPALWVKKPSQPSKDQPHDGGGYAVDRARPGISRTATCTMSRRITRLVPSPSFLRPALHRSRRKQPQGTSTPWLTNRRRMLSCRSGRGRLPNKPEHAATSLTISRASSAEQGRPNNVRYPRQPKSRPAISSIAFQALAITCADE